jgi:hypothetical protein
MSVLITNKARAYVNWGRWIADCPIDCGGALALSPGQDMFHCPECKTLSNIEWPGNPDDIWNALAERPAPKTRNWFPSGHVLALRANCPHGQTPAQLREETAENSGG